ncbi:MAG TPA: response regulator [Bryobacteraceae bacterium]|jgi:CheY-like chemotaxis protein|nr:response regulator [Bryobacteraceae bacterium]
MQRIDPGTKGSSLPARILVIEDNPSDIFLLRRALEGVEEHFELKVLADGEEALKFIQEHRLGLHPPEPCVIVLDLHLPKYDGMVVLRAIKRAPALEQVDVLVLSGLASDEEKQELLDLGVQSHSSKPTSLAEFRALAEEIIALCKKGSERALEPKNA